MLDCGHLWGGLSPVSQGDAGPVRACCIAVACDDALETVVTAPADLLSLSLVIVYNRERFGWWPGLIKNKFLLSTRGCGRGRSCFNQPESLAVARSISGQYSRTNYPCLIFEKNHLLENMSPSADCSRRWRQALRRLGFRGHGHGERPAKAGRSIAGWF
jgi:hypothetical protein